MPQWAGAIVGWYCAFMAALIYWIGAEVIEPGQQYADPLIPCIFVALLFGVPLGMVVAGLTAGRR